MPRFLVLLLALPAVGLLAGCGRSGGPALAPAEGIVTLDGSPLTDGYVFVTPKAGRMARGTIGADGRFVLGTFSDSDGVQVGEHPVTVLPPPTAEGSAPSPSALRLPPLYANAQTSGLTAQIAPGEQNELRLELSTKRR